jgi:hypothetical protein
MRAFILLSALMLIWLSGCGHDDSADADDPPSFVSWSIPDGAQIAGNATITAEFDKEIVTAKIDVTDATGTTHVAGKTAIWAPSGEIPPGEHTATVVVAEDPYGQAAIGLEPLIFTATRV